MKETMWHGPKGTTIYISHGSRKPPRWALLLIDRVARKARRMDVGLRWTQGDGGGYYYPGLRVVSVKAAGYGTATEKAVLVHELAHWLDPAPHGRAHGTTFWATAFLIAKMAGNLRTLTKEAGPTRARRARKMLADPTEWQAVWSYMREAA